MDAFIIDAVRTPIGKYAGALSGIRTDDLAAIPIKALMERNPKVKWEEVDDVIFGAANQAGEDNRNVARMAALLAGLPVEVPGTTINRLCASGMEAVGMAARAIKAGDYNSVVAGGVESMSRAPLVIKKAEKPFDRNAEIYDTTLGWRFVNPKMRQMFGVDSMAQTADNVAEEFGVSREDQDAFALRSQERYAKAKKDGVFGESIASVELHDGNIIKDDEHPRETSSEKLSGLKGINGAELSVTAGNAAGINDGAAAMIVAGEDVAKEHKPIAKIVGMVAAGVEPRIMGVGPVPAIKKLLNKVGMSIEQMDVVELNEAFAAQALAVTRQLGLQDDAEHVNPNGGAIAVGHPLGMSGARLVMDAAYQLQRTKGKYALCSMCVGVGQGTAMIIEGV